MYFKLNIMTTLDSEYFKLQEDANDNMNTCSRHIANTGSNYIKINGLQFRISDHKQPSHYQFRNYISVNCPSEIKPILISKGAWKTCKFTKDEFIKIYNDGGCYSDYVITKSKLYENCLFNGFNHFGDTESATSNLYYEIFNNYNN